MIQSPLLPVSDVSLTITESSSFAYLSISTNLDALRLRSIIPTYLQTFDHYNFQTYLLTLRQINSENYHFHTFLPKLTKGNSDENYTVRLSDR